MNPRAGYRADQARSYASIERIAKRLRAILAPGIGPMERLPSIRLFEHLNDYSVSAEGHAIPIDYATKEHLPREGLTIFDSDDGMILVALRESTYLSLEREDPRARYTLAHEVGHAVLHPEELVRLGRIPHWEAAMHRGAAPDHPPYLDTEWQANVLAAALLAPAEGLAMIEQRSRDLSPALVRGHFGVSWEAAEIRVKVFRSRRQELAPESY